MKIRICLVALCLLAFYCSAYGQTPNPQAEWEYMELKYPHPPIDTDVLNYYAKNGWEVVAAAGDGPDMVILKRSKSHHLFGTKTPAPPQTQPPLPPNRHVI